MLKAIIIDDETPSAKSLHTLLSKYCPQVEVMGIAEGVCTGIELIGSVRPDVVFLDIQMKDGTGFDLLERLPDIKFKLIFTTSYDQYAVKAFRYSAMDYLLKPINPEELILSVARLSEQIRISEIEQQVKVLLQNRNSFDRVALPTSEGIRFVKTNDILRCESDGNYTLIFLLSGEKILIPKTLKVYAEILPDDMFYRVHKSHLINIEHIKQYVNADGGYIVMSDNSKVDIAHRKRDEFMRLLLNRSGQSKS